MRVFIVLSLLFVGCGGVISQQVSSQSKAQAIAATFNKHKDSVKEKRGVRMVKYKDVRTEAVVRPSERDYAGVYEMPDLGYRIDIQISNDGTIQATGFEQRSRRFRLDNARIEGGLLSASKVYNDGSTERFEAVFMNRTVRNRATDAGTTAFGLGVVLNVPVEINGNTYERIFLEKH